MFLPALTGLSSSTKRVKFESAGSTIVTPPLLATTVTIDGVIDFLPSRSNSLLMIWVCSYSNGTDSDTTGVSRNGTALTSLGNTVGGNPDLRFSLWRILNPTSTDGTGVLITQNGGYPAGSRIAISWAYLYNVNLTLPLNTRANNTGTGLNPVLTASPTAGAIDTFPIAGFAGVNQGGSSVNWTSSSGQTRLTISAVNDIIGSGIDTETPSATSSFTVEGQITNAYQALMITTNVNPA